MRAIRFVVAATLAASIFVAQTGSVAAYTAVLETGMIGPWTFDDTYETPGGTCGYSREYPPNSAFFRWMDVRPPIVMAADRNSEVRDSKRVTWFWKLQRAFWDGSLGPWQTVEVSDKQTAIAYEDQAAAFTTLRIRRSTHTNYQNPYVFRALVTIQWKNRNGNVEGTAKASIDYYLANFPWGPYVTGRPFCAGHTTSG